METVKKEIPVITPDIDIFKEILPSNAEITPLDKEVWKDKIIKYSAKKYNIEYKLKGYNWKKELEKFIANLLNNKKAV